jgi:hypothetical protein
MGTWGTGLFDDDVALDAKGLFDDLVDQGASPGQAAEQVLEEMQHEANDQDDGPVLVLALASLLLDHSIQVHPVLEKAREVINTGAGLDRWEDASPKALSERRLVCQELLARLP